MKRIILILTFLIIFAPCALCDSDAADGSDWNYEDLGAVSQSSKFVSDEEFKGVVDRLKTRPKSFFSKIGDKFKKKTPENDPVFQKELKFPSETSILEDVINQKPDFMLSVTLIGEDGGQIPVGHYKLSPQKTQGGEYYINFLQGRNIVGKIKAQPTKDDSLSKNRIIYADSTEIYRGVLKIICANVDEVLEGFARIEY